MSGATVRFRIQSERFRQSVCLLAALCLLAGWMLPLQASTLEEETALHPLGRNAPGDSPTRVAIRDFEIWDEHPVFGPERIVLSTVGTEEETDDGTLFHPLVSVAVDRSLDPEGPGEWMAIWNLGRKGPGVLSRIGAAFPGFTPWKNSSQGKVRELERKLENFDRRWDKGKVSIPKPYLKVTQENRRSTIGLILTGLRTGFGNILDLFPLGSETSFGVELFFRNYLLRHKDLQERDFAQAYLGMLWYTDAATADPRAEALDPRALEEIKYRLLKERSIFGRWVDPAEKPDYVHGFESEMRDHLWGTSCLLASEANRYHLAYEELHRYTATGIPLALGGILYYDPAQAPEAEQVRWSILNPFDLSYDPFQNPEVLKAASSGQKVPLALYVYQSNMALKPIIVADFFSPDNPRLREAATYWRRLGNEAIGAAGVRLIYKLMNRAFRFAANRKEITWFADSKDAYGIEELRLSLGNHLYFEPEAADELADQVDRLIVNPLAQPTRVKATRAQIQYRALLADGGQAVLHEVRKIRDHRIRSLLHKKHQQLAQADYARYRVHLQARREMAVLQVFLDDEFLPSVPAQEVQAALDELASPKYAGDRALIDGLMKFRLELQDRPAVGPMRDFRRQVDDRTQRTLLALYEASGRAPDALEDDLSKLREIQKAEALKAHQKWARDHADKVAKEIKESLEVLEGFVESGGDLDAYSPWYIAESLEVMQQIPQAVAVNPLAAEKFSKFEDRISTAVDGVEDYLRPGKNVAAEADWMIEQRDFCFRTAQITQVTLNNFRATTGMAAAAVEVSGQGAHQQ